MDIKTILLKLNLRASKGLEVKMKNRLINSHMSLETLLEALEKADLRGTKVIYLLHLSRDNSDEEIMKEEVQRVVGDEVEVIVAEE